MVTGIESVNGSYYPTRNSSSGSNIHRSLLSFDEEDQAIISAQAKLLNELEKFNSGEGDIIDLALTSVMSEHEVAANARVIDTKKEMIDSLFEIFD